MAAKTRSVSQHHRRLADRIAQDTDDVLCTIQLVRANAELTDRLFDSLVDLLVEQLFCDLRLALSEGALSQEAYAVELATLAAQCRQAGLLPLPSAGPGR